MRVVTIEEDNHGMIGIAKTYADAVYFLVNNDWLSALTEIYCGDEGFKTVIEDLGENWLAVILNWSMEKFCKYFEGYFYLYSIEIYEVAQLTSLIADGRKKIKKILDNRKCMWYYNYRKRGNEYENL